MEKVTVENIIEDLQLVAEYGETILRVENGQSLSYEIDSTEDLFKLLSE